MLTAAVAAILADEAAAAGTEALALPRGFVPPHRQNKWPRLECQCLTFISDFDKMRYDDHEKLYHYCKRC